MRRPRAAADAWRRCTRSRRATRSPATSVRTCLGPSGGGWIMPRMPTLIEKPSVIAAAGNKPKIIEEFIGRVNSRTDAVSVARMQSPSGWVEPGQTPEFDEYTVVLRGSLRVTTRGGAVDVNAGEAATASKGEWVQYSTPYAEGAEYIAVCLPAFASDIVHREIGRAHV